MHDYSVVAEGNSNASAAIKQLARARAANDDDTQHTPFRLALIRAINRPLGPAVHGRRLGTLIALASASVLPRCELCRPR